MVKTESYEAPSGRVATAIDANITRAQSKHTCIVAAVSDMDAVSRRLEGLLVKITGEKVPVPPEATLADFESVSFNDMLVHTPEQIRTKIERMMDQIAHLESLLF